MTTYTGTAFSASWNNSGDFLAREGLNWSSPQPYTSYGTITAQFAEQKTGTAGGYSYIGIYGWSVSPCVEFYIVDDSYNGMPVNPGNTTNKGTVTIDGGDYILYTRPTSGTGGSNCPGVSSWIQYYSVRKTARQCGQISITQHFDAWKNASMTLGNVQQAQLLIEVGGGSGSINFTNAVVTAQ
jgi:glycosyl hydrolase family 11